MVSPPESGRQLAKATQPIDLLGSIALLPVSLLLAGRGVAALSLTLSILICGGLVVVLAGLALTTRSVRELD